MKPLSIMLIAGEASGDLLAAELVGALRQKALAGSLDATENVHLLRTALERQIAATDTQIDRLVYDLYGLTGDEIKIVEGTMQ